MKPSRETAERREHMLHVLSDDRGKRVAEALFRDYVQDPKSEGEPGSWKRFPEFLLALDGLVREFGGHQRAEEEGGGEEEDEGGEDKPNSDDEYDVDDDIHDDREHASDAGELDRVKAAIAKVLAKE